MKTRNSYSETESLIHKGYFIFRTAYPRFAMSLKNKKAKYRNRRSLEVDPKAVEILRTVGDKEAFYFYEDVGRPTGEVARNLFDFLDKVKSAKSESLVFHLQRGDFQNWIQGILGDPKLAKDLRRVSSSDIDNARTAICKNVENRLKKLRELSVGVMVNENPTALLP